jgi:FKBP-type peptidyl-prolyl cis-trans isomerase 2
MTKIQNGDLVTVHYTGKLEDGSVFDSSLDEGREPIVVKLGEGTLIKGFENGLIDMEVGEKKTVEINPEDAYGQPNELMVSEVQKNQVPEGIKVGDMLQAMTPNGPVNVTVLAVNEDTVTLDANHPLSGKKLIFELEVVSVVGV